MLFLFYCLLAYLLYQFIFKFVIPVYKTTRQVKKGFQEMKGRMQQRSNNTQAHPKKESHTIKKGDYIDFEEVPPGR